MPRSSNVRAKISWTEVMISNLLLCKERALSLANSENPPRYPNGRKIGYMKQLYNFWNEMGYESLKLTEQNLSDQARKCEHKQTQFLTPISETIDTDTLNDIFTENANSEVIKDGLQVNNIVLNADKLNQLSEEAEKVFNDISAVRGDFSNRNFKTKFRTTPNDEDIKYIDEVCERLITRKNVENFSNVLMAFWTLNCILYAVIKAWIVINNIKNMECIKVVKPGHSRLPKSIVLIDKEIKATRALTSKVYAELNRVKTNGRLTKKSKRNRAEMMKHCPVISSYNLTCYLERLKKRLKYLGKKRSRKLKSEKAKIMNNQFANDQKQIFDKFRAIIEIDPENLKPIYKEQIKPKRYFEKPEKVEEFWGQLWGSPDKGQPLAPWLEDFRLKFSEIIPEVEEGNLEVDKTIVHNAIRKKKNWSAPGPDKIVNFWLKKLPSIQKASVVIFYNIINVVMAIEKWVSQGQVALIPKDGEWAVPNQRPITCLNTFYKWLTSILLIFHNDHAKKYQLLQIDQRGAKSNSTGTVNNLLIDDAVLRDAALHHRNLFCFWIDVKKAFDSVSHSWLIRMLEIHRFPSKIVNIFRNIVNSWSVQISIPVKDGFKISKVINLTNGILQGDSYCPALYVLSMNVVSWLIRSTEGYVLSKPISKKVTHTLYIDDLKGYTKSMERLKFVLNLVKAKMEEAGLFWNAKKCKFMAMQRGKFSPCENITLNGGDIIKCLGERDSYEFMGVPQRMKMNADELSQELSKVVKQRSYIIWSSDLSDINKCKASNQFVNSAIEYYFWPVKFAINTIKEMDISIRNTMNVLGAKHTNQMNSINYLPRDKGGRGLRSLEDTYKATKIKLAVKLHQDTDHRLDLVKEFHKANIDTSSFSLFKDASKYAFEIGITLRVTESDIEITSSTDDEPIKDTPSNVGRSIKEKQLTRHHSEIVNSSWQGINLVQRINDETVVKSYFDWLKNWKTCPTSNVQEFFLMFYQLLPTKQYQINRSKKVIEDTTCRMCHKFPQESVKHLISNCEEFVKGIYKRRHDNALKCFVWALLHQFELIDKQPCWYAPDKVKPYYENNEIKFWWDCPEYTGRDDENEDNTLRPDGKLIIEKNGEKKIYLVEITVPWIENREDKYDFKTTKYIYQQQNLKLEYPGFEVSQITLAIDVFGGYSKNLEENIGKVINKKEVVQEIIKNMQKVIISSLANLSRVFKIRCL